MDIYRVSRRGQRSKRSGNKGKRSVRRRTKRRTSKRVSRRDRRVSRRRNVKRVSRRNVKRVSRRRNTRRVNRRQTKRRVNRRNRRSRRSRRSRRVMRGGKPLKPPTFQYEAVDTTYGERRRKPVTMITIGEVNTWNGNSWEQRPDLGHSVVVPDDRIDSHDKHTMQMYDHSIIKFDSSIGESPQSPPTNNVDQYDIATYTEYWAPRVKFVYKGPSEVSLPQASPLAFDSVVDATMAAQHFKLPLLSPPSESEISPEGIAETHRATFRSEAYAVIASISAPIPLSDEMKHLIIGLKTFENREGHSKSKATLKQKIGTQVTEATFNRFLKELLHHLCCLPYSDIDDELIESIREEILSIGGRGSLSSNFKGTLIQFLDFVYKFEI